MHRIRIASAAKLLMTSTVKNNLHHGSADFLEMVTPTCSLVLSSTRNLHSTRPSYALVNKTHEVEKGFFQNIIMSIKNHFDPAKYRLLHLGYLLYEEAVDTIDYKQFYKEFRMPDTFYSWFVITELHVWMMMVRCMAEGKEGQVLRNTIVEAMWKDVTKRTGQLGTKKSPINHKIVKNQVTELSQQFNACVIAYDEGITGDDKILAAAIWRRFLQSECNDPEVLEKMVFYVRKQMSLLEKMSWEELMKKRSITWKGLDLIKSN